MHTFNRSLVNISVDLARDEQDISDAAECIRSVHCVLPGMWEAIIKEHWVLHAQRLSLVSGLNIVQQRDVSSLNSRLKDAGKICFRKSTAFYGEQYAAYAAFLSSLRENPSCFADMLHRFISSPLVFERLFSILFCSITNFCLTEDHSLFLRSVLQQMFNKTTDFGIINTDFLTDLRSSFHTRFFLEGLPDARRYLSTLLCELITEIHAGRLQNCHGNFSNIDTPDGLMKTSKINSHSNPNYNSVSHSEFIKVTNNLIHRFHRTATFFPPSCLLWLHCLRKALRSLGASDTVLRQSSTEHILSFVTRGLINPQLILSSGPYLEPGEHTLLKSIASVRFSHTLLFFLVTFNFYRDLHPNVARQNF